MIRARADRLFDRFRRTGDPAALAELFDRTAPELWRVATYLARDPHLVEELVLDAGAERDHPRGCVLEGSADGERWQELARASAGDGPRTTLRFAPTRVRALRVIQTGASEEWWWSIHQVSFCGRRT